VTIACVFLNSAADYKQEYCWKKTTLQIKPSIQVFTLTPLLFHHLN